VAFRPISRKIKIKELYTPTLMWDVKLCFSSDGLWLYPPTSGFTLLIGAAKVEA